MGKGVFERQWFYGITVIILLVAGSMFLVYSFTSIAIKAAINNTPLSGGWTWGTLLLADLLSLAVCGYLCNGPITQLLTKFTETGIEQPAFPHQQLVKWQDIQRVVGLTTSNIQLIGSGGRIVINPNLYKNPRGLIQEIQLRAPGAIFPSSDELNQEIALQRRDAAGRSALGSFFMAVIMFAVAKNSVAIFVGGLMAVYGLYEAWKWVQMGRTS